MFLLVSRTLISKFSGVCLLQNKVVIKLELIDVEEKLLFLKNCNEENKGGVGLYDH